MISGFLCGAVAVDWGLACLLHTPLDFIVLLVLIQGISLLPLLLLVGLLILSAVFLHHVTIRVPIIILFWLC